MEFTSTRTFGQLLANLCFQDKHETKRKTGGGLFGLGLNGRHITLLEDSQSALRMEWTAYVSALTSVNPDKELLKCGNHTHRPAAQVALIKTLVGKYPRFVAPLFFREHRSHVHTCSQRSHGGCCIESGEWTSA